MVRVHDMEARTAMVQRPASHKKLPPQTAPSKANQNSSLIESTGRHVTAPHAPVTHEDDQDRVMDLSGRGLTTLPSNMYENREAVRELLLFSNNLRVLPTDLRRFKYLNKIDLRGNSIKCAAADDASGFPAALAQFQHLKSLILAECSLRYIPPTVWKLTCLEHLDLSKNKINELSPAVGNLLNVRVLNLKQCHLKTLPQDIVYCEALEEMYLWGNSIESLPDTMIELRNLRILELNIRFFATTVSGDPMIVNLLKKGQIKSDHMPIVLYVIPSLETLDFERCMINALPETTQKNARELLLNSNFFYTLPVCVNDMQRLHVLDLSDNFLTDLPNELHLPELRILRLSKNNLETFPFCVTKSLVLENLYLDFNKIRNLPNEIGGMISLKLLNLEGNSISRLPESICSLTNLVTLDLSRNKLKTLPLNIHQLVNLRDAHIYRKFEHSGLWLFQNPLLLPPEEVWKTDNTKKLYHYMKQLQIARTENLVRQKLIVTGKKNCGKTSFIGSLVQGRSELCPEGENTFIKKETRWRTENNVQFLIIELAGDECYTSIRPLFVDHAAMYVILYDQTQMTKDNYYDNVGRYLDLLHLHAPGALVKLVATKGDLSFPRPIPSPGSARRDTDRTKLDSQKTSLINSSATSHPRDSQKRSLQKNLDLDNTPKEVETLDPETIRTMTSEYQNNYKTKLESILENITKAKNSTEERRFILQRIANLVSNPLRIIPTTAAVHCNTGTPGLGELVAELEAIVIDKNLMPFAQRDVPAHWTAFGAKLKRLPGYFTTMDTAATLGHDCKLQGGTDLSRCLNHLHDIGDIFWPQHLPHVGDIIFQNPADITTVISCLYRHDIHLFMDYNKNHAFSAVANLDSEAFRVAKTNFFTQGQASDMMMKCFWLHQKLDYDELTKLKDVLHRLNLLYTVPTPDIPTKTSTHEPSVVIPIYVSDEHVDISYIWSETVPERVNEIQVQYTFPAIQPENILEKFSVEIQNLVSTRIDWKNLIYATLEHESVLVERLDGKMIVRVRGERQIDVTSLAEQLHNIMIDLLKSMPGLIWESSLASDLATNH